MSGTNDNVIVLHLITRYLDGGAETSTEDALQALQAASENYDLRLGTGAEYDEDRLDNISNNNIETVVFPAIRHYNPLSAVMGVFTIAWYLQREQVDVIHTHSTEAGIIGRLAGWLAKTPTIIHEIHGDPIANDRNPVLNAFLYLAERLCAPIATKIVVGAERIRELYLERGIGSADQYEIIYDGVDTEAFRQASENLNRSKSNQVRLLFVGRLADGKGLFDLLSAIDQMQDSNIRLDIIGDGPIRSDIQNAVNRRGLDDIVTIHGYCDDVPSAMATADILVLPSYREGTPRVITEARATGLPVVATDIAGIPEMVRDGETGFLVPPGDVDKFRSHLQDLVSSPDLRRRMSDRTQEGLERFERETTAQAYRDLYRAVLSSL